MNADAGPTTTGPTTTGPSTKSSLRSSSPREPARGAETSPARAWRKRIEKGLTLAGIAVILGPVMTVTDSIPVLALVLLGIIMLEAGVWGLARRVLPEEREYLGLRMEVENFLRLVRELNGLAVEGDGAGVRATEDHLHRQVERIVRAAGWSSKT